MTLQLLKDKGVPIDQQAFSWHEIVPPPYSKLDDDAFTRIRVILMNGIEAQAVRFKHALALLHEELRPHLARVRRVDHHQQTLVNWLNPADQSALETTIGFEQVAIEVTAAVAEKEPDPYLAQVYRFGLLEDFDHLYRYSALMDRVMGKDASTILQGYTDVLPGRPTSVEHRHPDDDLRSHYDKDAADPLTKLHAMTILSGEFMTHDYYMTVGPTFSDPVARQLYAEIASIEEQHVTQYGSIIDPNETPLEKWLLFEACEAYNYWSCVEHEQNSRIRKIWERCLEYELGHVAYVAELLEKLQGRDAASLLPDKIEQPIEYVSHREFVRGVLRREVDLRANGTQFVPLDQEHPRTQQYRSTMNRDGSPSDMVAAGYTWQPGTELVRSFSTVSGNGRANGSDDGAPQSGRDNGQETQTGERRL